MKKLTEEISLFFSDKEYRIGELTIDAVIKENHELRAQISEHPTEKGNSFCDHVSRLPVTLQIEGIISNTPLTFIGMTAIESISNFINDRSNDLAELAFVKLEEIFAKRTPITIATSLKDYDNMMLESLSVERGGENSASLHFRVTAKQIRLVEQMTIAIDLPPEAKLDRAKPKRQLGKQESKPPSEAIVTTTTEKRSMLDALLQWGK